MGEWISLLFASLCLTARLALCYHGNRDWFGMVRSMEGAKRGKKRGKASTCSLPPATQGKSSQRDRRWSSASCLMQHQRCPISCTSLVLLLLYPYTLQPSTCFPKSPFLTSVPSIQEYEWVMTVGWPRVVNKNCNYKKVSPTYYNRHDRVAITCLTSVLAGHMKSIFNNIYKFILFTT